MKQYTSTANPQTFAETKNIEYISAGEQATEETLDEFFRSGKYSNQDIQSVQALMQDTDRLTAMHKCHSRWVTQDGYGIKKSELLSKNMIDISAVLGHTDKMEELAPVPPHLSTRIKIEYANQYFWYNLVPCYSEGVLKVNEGRFYWFIIDNVDTIHGSYDLFLQEYLLRKGNMYEPYGFGMIKISFQDTERVSFQENGKIRYSMEILEQMTNSEVFNSINLDETNWTNAEKIYWKEFVVKQAEKMERCSDGYTQIYGGEIEPIIRTVTTFLGYVLVSNYYLHINKPVADRKANKENKIKYVKLNTPEDLPDKIIRTVGKTVFTSKKPPVESTKETIRKIHYKTAVWESRGGIRTLKSGKKVIFKSSIKRRKALLGFDEENTPQNIISIVDNTLKKEDDKNNG